ncbi:MAG TPA: hypothetical protein VIY29_21400 [Ktedonobacteraceae bacterium]
MGLIARAIEQVGISTVCLNLLLATPSTFVRPPRTLLLSYFPFSLPLGQPGNTVMQRQLLLDALDLLTTCHSPGTVLRKFYKVWEEMSSETTGSV